MFELDDRFTATDASSIAAAGYQGGKMLLRIDLDDPATADTMQASADAVSDLAGHDLMAMVEPFMSHRVDGRRQERADPGRHGARRRASLSGWAPRRRTRG